MNRFKVLVTQLLAVALLVMPMTVVPVLGSPLRRRSFIQLTAQYCRSRNRQ